MKISRKKPHLPPSPPEGVILYPSNSTFINYFIVSWTYVTITMVTEYLIMAPFDICLLYYIVLSMKAGSTSVLFTSVSPESRVCSISTCLFARYTLFSEIHAPAH